MRPVGVVEAAPVWHLLQVSDVLDLELGNALAELTPVIAWEPQRSWSPWATRPGNEPERLVESGLRVRKLPLIKGYARFPLSAISGTWSSIVERLERQSSDPQRSPLLCTIPYFAAVAEQWKGPVVYWLTDLIAEYAGADRKQVEALDARMCSAATLVCPNSQRLADYLMDRARCDPRKIHIIPNATRAVNLLPAVPTLPGELPADARELHRPIAGVIGNLAGNMDWVLLERTMAHTPWLSWLFVGPSTMEIPDATQARARNAVMQHPRARFVGKRPYGELASYARAFDVAVLPYRRCEPTYSGSSTRFYEHLAACRPMIATRGFEELLHKPPMLELVDTAYEAANALEGLRACHFNDGRASLRWRASREGTWQTRASCMKHALEQRLGAERNAADAQVQCASEAAAAR